MLRLVRWLNLEGARQMPVSSKDRTRVLRVQVWRLELCHKILDQFGYRLACRCKGIATSTILVAAPSASVADLLGPLGNAWGQ